MMTVLTRASNNQPVTLGKQIASSGEGEVWETNLSGVLAKIYHNPTPERIEKLKAMIANPPVDPMASQNHISIAFPQDLLKDGNGTYIGFLMPAVRGSRELTTVYNPSLRKKKAPGFNWYYLHVTALNTAWIVQAIHEKGYVLGDIKPQNILVNDRALVAVIDTDSFQVRDSTTGKIYRCTVGSEGFTPVELLGKDFSISDQTEIHDRFRLGVLIHYLLFGYHPFSGEWTGAGDPPEQTELIHKGFWYGGQNSLIRPSQTTILLDVVHPEIKRCFLKCFNNGHASPYLRPTAEDWRNALQVAINELIACGRVNSHYYSRGYGNCYWCERKGKLGVDIFPGMHGAATTPLTATQTVPSQQFSKDFTEDLGNGITLAMVYIPGGTFLMGAPESEKNSTPRERPQHRVTVPSFYMGKFQVTQAQWKAVSTLSKVNRNLESNPSRFKGESHPIECVSWYDAVEFCARLSRKTGREYRLPSEAEWEYACRAGTTTPFHFGETITTDLANYDGNYTYGSASKGIYRQETTPVGSFPPNAFGLYDMHGNVWEWCADTWHDNYEGAPTDGSAWLRGDDNCSPVRGGSWLNLPYVCRSACRGSGLGERDYILDLIGCRVVCGVGRTR
jgi:formylglycine-generating enzyme required for sulfatase activity